MARHHGYRVRSITRQWPRAMGEGVLPSIVRRTMSAVDAVVDAFSEHPDPDLCHFECTHLCHCGPYDPFMDVPDSHSHLLVNRPAGRRMYIGNGVWLVSDESDDTY